MARIDIGTIVRGDNLNGHICPHCGDSLNFKQDKEDSTGKQFPTLKAEHCGTTYSATVRELFIDVDRPNAADIAAINEELEEGEAFTQKFRNKGVEDVMKQAQKIRGKKSGAKEPEKDPETVEELVKFQQQKAEDSDEQTKKAEDSQKKSQEKDKPQTEQQKTEERASEKIKSNDREGRKGWGF